MQLTPEKQDHEVEEMNETFINNYKTKFYWKRENRENNASISID